MLRCHWLWSLSLLLVLHVAVQAQQQQQQEPPPPAPVNPPPGPEVIAATVNGTPIPEIAVYRALQQAPTAARAELRPEVVGFLIENALVDQYLDQMKIAIDAKELDAQIAKVKTEIATKYKDVDTFFKMLNLTEAEFRVQINQTMRWEKFINQYANEKALKDFHDASKPLFDGSQMRAKHILAAAKPGDAAAAEQAKTKILGVKKAIEDKVAKGLADAGKLDNLELQKRKMKLLEEAFSEAAFKDSDCPSKSSGGELGWFPRSGGRMVEAFAKASFATKVWELSEPIPTEFGWHLILNVDSKAGVERKYEDIKEIVKDVYADKMREAVLQRMKPAAKIVVNAAPK